ncbi:MAG: hypothetical protein H0V17_22365, partial [Deltaproteobacteria bacterium]|nr:hypothetical protein [Deltaproteobacteria bacterium]
PYRLMISVMYSMKSDGIKRFDLVAKSSGKLVSVPIALPERAPVARGARDGEPRRPGADLTVQIDAIKAGNAQVTVGPGVAGVTIARATTTPPSSLSDAVVTSKIRAMYTPGIRRCAGKADAGKQRVAIDAKIDPNGRIATPKIGAKAEVRSCLESAIAMWRFPIPRDADGEPTIVALSLALAIEPSPDVTPDGPQSGAPPDDQPLGMFVSIMKTEMIVWSVSGLEGTLREPLRSYKLPDPDATRRLTDDLTYVVKKRWERKPRPPASLSIVVMADAATPMQWIAEVLGAVRKTKTGDDLFPDIQLSSGFE